MGWSVTFAPLVPVAVIVVLAAAGMAMGIFSLVVRARGATLRTLAMAALVLALLNPVVRDEERENLTDIAVVVVDRSASQQLASRPGRTEAALEDLSRQLERIPNLEVRQVVEAAGSHPTEGGTMLFSRLFAELADVPPERFAGAVMITDGRVHDIPGSFAESGYSGPVHALITGDRNERDRRLIIERAPRYGIVGQSQPMTFRIEDDHAEAGARARVTVSTDGGEPAEIDVPIGVTVEYPIEIEHGGPTVTEIAVSPAEGELSQHNNRAVITTDGIRDRLRVLLVSGQPHPGERTWRNLLKADAAVDLVHFTILRPPEKQDGTPIGELSLIAFPTRELFSVKLEEFDLVIFDRYQHRGILPLIYLSNVADYVEKGGAVLIAADPSFAGPMSLYRTPISTIVPSVPTGEVTVEPFRPLITEQGKRHPVTRDLPGAASDPPDWGRWFRIIDVEEPSGHVVMSGPGDKPLMILDRRGEGRVAQLLSDHAWLWTRGYEGGGPQAELLRRLAHWLMKEPDLEEEALTAAADGRALVVMRRSMEDDVAPVTITSPSGAEETVTLTPAGPGQWQARVETREVGVYRLDDGTLKAIAAVGPADDREMRDVRASGEPVRPIVEETGGGLFWIADGRPAEAVEVPRVRTLDPGRRMAGNGWLGLKRNDAYIVRAVVDLPLFSTLLALAVLLGLLGSTWYREGR